MAGRCLGLMVLALLFCIGVAQAGDSDRANPPDVVTTTRCASGFADYRRALQPFYFALSRDGKHCSYSYCNGGCRIGNVRGQTLNSCQGTAGAAPCEIYAYGGSVTSKRDIRLEDRGTP